jgi:hypothetical protein
VRAGLKVKGNQTLAGLKRTLHEMPLTVAASVADRAEPVLTRETRGAFSSGRTVYGEPRPAGVDGKPLDLKATGDVSRELRFEAIGTIVRCRLGPEYSKYLIGKYGILPNGALPASWKRDLDRLVAETKAPPL